MFQKILLRLLPFVVLTAFFVWRAISLQTWFHISLAVIGGLGMLLILINKLKSDYRGNILNLGISIVFLDIVFYQISLDKFADSLFAANWWLMIPSVLALMIHLIFRIWRWQWLLKPFGDIPFGPAWRAGMIGIGGNMVLPARAGEFLRAYAIGRSTQISKTGAFATVVLERIFDGLTVLLFLILLIIFGVRDTQLQQYGILGGGFFILALIGLVLLIWKQAWFEFLIKKFLPQLIQAKVLALLHAFTSGLTTLKDVKQLLIISAYSIITWIFVILSFWPILEAFEFHASMPFFAAVLSVPIIAFGLTIPGAPGGLGIFELASVLAIDISFRIIGNPLPLEYEAVAAACAVMLHISQSAPEALLGIWCFIQEGLTLGDLEVGREI